MEISGFTPLIPGPGTVESVSARAGLVSEALPTLDSARGGLALAVARQGGRFRIVPHNQGLLWTLTCLTDGWTGLLCHLSETMAHATGDPDGLARHAEVITARAAEDQYDHSAVAAAAVRRMLSNNQAADFAPSLTHSDTELAVQLLNGERLITALDMRRACFTAVGSIDAHSAMSALTDFTTALTKTDTDMTAQCSTPESLRASGRWQRINVGGGESTCVRAAWAVPGRSAAEHAALYAAHLVLGGGYGARLMQRFRESLRWSYSPWSNFHHYAAYSLLEVNIDVPTRHRQAAEQILMEEVERLRTERVPDAELRRVVAHACGTLAASLASQSGLAAMLTHVQSLGLPYDWLWNWPGNLRAVTPAQVLQVAQDWLHPDRAAGATVGPVTS
ncbi:pitrilysin family protein [Streptomyces sp. NBRC 110028]|uniref:M16 family metallopeptidase n=1 Tax=Streptomyces sp. NBRC 110028 TaxID=1621260 RepID=UPI00131C4026|nr:insulinase family protein [Streptomyces sp. NBRC 110028]